MNAATLTGPSPPSPREPPIVLRRRAPSPARRSPGAAGPTRPARPHSTRRYRRPAPGPPIGRDPVPQSALVDPEIPGHLSDRLTGLPYDPDRPSPELLIKLASRLGHYTASLLRVPPGYEGKPSTSSPTTSTTTTSEETTSPDATPKQPCAASSARPTPWATPSASTPSKPPDPTHPATPASQHPPAADAGGSPRRARTLSAHHHFSGQAETKYPEILAYVEDDPEWSERVGILEGRIRRCNGCRPGGLLHVPCGGCGQGGQD